MNEYLNAILAAMALWLNLIGFFRSGDVIYLVFAMISFGLTIAALPN